MLISLDNLIILIFGGYFILGIKSVLAVSIFSMFLITWLIFIKPKLKNDTSSYRETGKR